MTTKKIEDYKNGEIYRTPSGNYVFVEGEKHAGEYESVEVLKQAIDRRDGQQSPTVTLTDDEPSGNEKPANSENKSISARAKRSRRKVR